MELITPEEAEERGLRFYTSGKRCRYDHDCPRYTKNGQCVKCASHSQRKKRPKSLPDSLTKQEQIERFEKLGARLIKGRCDSGSK